MGGSKQSKRVSWAPDGELCQVRPYQLDRCSSQGGRRAQIHIPAKQLSKYRNSNEPMNMLTVKSTQIPVIKWKCPPEFQVKSEWQVAAGEESTEKRTQNQKSTPFRPWTVPLRPSSAMEPVVLVTDVQNTPLIPLVPIEELHPDLDKSDSAETLSSQEIPDTNPPANGVVSASRDGTIPNLSDLRDLIDIDLLEKVLTDPKMIQELFSLGQDASLISQRILNLSSPPRNSALPINIATTTGPFHPTKTGTPSIQNETPSIPIRTDTVLGPFHPTETGEPPIQHVPNLKSTLHSSAVAISTAPFHPTETGEPTIQRVPNLKSPPKSSVIPATANGSYRPAKIKTDTATVPFHHTEMRKSSRSSILTHYAPQSAFGAGPPVEDMNYYRTLIQLHGGGVRQDVLPELSRDIYSNSSCAYPHDAWGEHVALQQFNHRKWIRQYRPNQIAPQKRMKLDRQMTSAPWLHSYPLHLSYGHGYGGGNSYN